MSYRTEFHFNVELIKDLPREVVAVLDYLMQPDEFHKLLYLEGIALPNHSFFSTDRWEGLLVADSYIFSAITRSEIKFDSLADCHYLSIRSNIKNYCNEIQEFVSWITPYIRAKPGDFLGFLRFENSQKPILIYHPDTYFQV